MSTIEERLRAAAEAAASTVADASAPPLRLPGHVPHANGRGPRGWHLLSNGQWRGWAAPLAAALGVAVVVSVSLAASRVIGAGTHHAGPAANHQPPVIPAIAHPVTAGGLPPFYVTVSGSAIVSSGTGRVVARLSLPGTAIQTAAGWDDRTFYAAVRGCLLTGHPVPTPVPSPTHLRSGSPYPSPGPATTPSIRPVPSPVPTAVPSVSPSAAAVPNPSPTPTPSTRPSPQPSHASSATPRPAASPDRGDGRPASTGAALSLTALRVGSTTAAVPGSPHPARGACLLPSSGPATFYKISLTDRGARVGKLPIPAVKTPVTGIAPSPNGAQLAIATTGLPGGSGQAADTVIVAPTAGGPAREWSASQPGLLDQLGWLADGHTLTFNWSSRLLGTANPELRLLDTAAPGRDLLPGHGVVRLSDAAGHFKYLTLSPDGSTVLGAEKYGAGQLHGRAIPVTSVVAFSAHSGQPTGVVFAAGQRDHGTLSGCGPLWTDRAGQRVLTACVYSPAGTYRAEDRVFLAGPGGKVQPLPRLSQAYSRLRFALGGM